MVNIFEESNYSFRFFCIEYIKHSVYNYGYIADWNSGKKNIYTPLTLEWPKIFNEFRSTKLF